MQTQSHKRFKTIYKQLFRALNSRVATPLGIWGMLERIFEWEETVT